MGSISNFHYKEALLKRGIASTEDLVLALKNCDYSLLKRLSISSLVEDLVSSGCITREEGDFFVIQKSVISDYSAVTKCAISSKKNLYREWQLFYGTINRLKVPVCYAPMVLLMYLCYYDREFEVYLKENRLSLDIDARGICNSIYRYMYYLKLNKEKSYKAVGFLFTGFPKSSIESYLHIQSSEDFYGKLIESMRAFISVDMARKQMFSVV